MKRRSRLENCDRPTSSTAANAAVSVNAPSLVAWRCAKSITGRTQPRRDEISTMSSALPSSRTRPMTSTPNGTARSFVSRRARKLAKLCRRHRPARGRASRPRRNPGWKTTSSAPPACAIPAVWSSIPSARLYFASRSRCPRNAASGACTESAIPARGRSRRARRRTASPSRSRLRNRARRPYSPARRESRQPSQGLPCSGGGPARCGRFPCSVVRILRPGG